MEKTKGAGTMKIYGNEKTRLELTEKAQRIYSESDPLQIIEQDDGTYSARGIIDRDGMTAAEVNKMLEDMSDDITREEARQIIQAGLYAAAVELMDNETREAIHAEKAPCSEEDFLTEYLTRHREKFGEDFTI
jgi:hypothetical protein